LVFWEIDVCLAMTIVSHFCLFLFRNTAIVALASVCGALAMEIYAWAATVFSTTEIETWSAFVPFFLARLA
jgi:hypothetical protein